MNNRKPIKKRASLYDAHFYNILDYFILAILVASVYGKAELRRSRRIFNGSL